MTSINAFINLNKTDSTPLYLQITNGFIQAIRNGQLPKGLKLAGTRDLAQSLQVHRRTMQTALDELEAQGWLTILARKGTFIAQKLPEFRPISLQIQAETKHYPALTHFEILPKSSAYFPSPDAQQNGQLLLMEGFPDIRLSPLSNLMREIRSIEKRAIYRKYFQYGNPQGTLHLRGTFAQFLGETRGLNITPDNILITRGAQMGIYIAAQLLIKSGDVVVVGNPSYITATSTFEQAGAKILRIPVDEFGIQVEGIEAICQAKKKIRAVYVIPHHHQPTTVTLTLERRLKLLNLAEKYHFAIIEDDYDYDFHYSTSPMMPMASLDRCGSVIYIGTLSKTLAPSIRLGFIVAPANLIKSATQIRRNIDLQGDSILEIAMAELYKNGTIQSYIKKIVKVYHHRRDHFCQLLKTELGDAVSFKIPDGGMAVWTKFNDVNMTEIVQEAATKGVMILDGSVYNTAQSQNATRLGFAALNEAEQERAITILKDCF
jgi:GntR family transcriptional regulator / MocR family aminotransferase